MAKITDSMIEQAKQDLRKANGNRSVRTMPEQDLLDYIKFMEASYGENYNKKYFRGVQGHLLATYDDKPKSYNYTAYMTTVYIEIIKSEKPVIRVQKEYWDYISHEKAKKLTIIWD